jgi:Zn-dependent protease
MDFDANRIVASLIVIFLAIGIHEFAHCKFADLAGDPTPRNQGRVTLNLFKHFDPLGSMMILVTVFYGFGLGWGRPAPMDPRKMKNPKWDFFIAVAAGPLSNVVQAIIWAFLFRLMIGDQVIVIEALPLFVLIPFFGIVINLALATFNMIPLGPLDGHWLLGILMPEKIGVRWYQFNRQYGIFALLALILIPDFIPGVPDLIRGIIVPIVETGLQLLIG